MYNPLTIAKLQESVRANSFATFEEFSRLINEHARNRCTLRGLLNFRQSLKPVPLEEVEPAREIRLRCAAIGQRAQGFGALMGGEHWRASHMLSARHGAGAPLPCPRNDQLALKLGQPAQHRQH